MTESFAKRKEVTDQSFYPPKETILAVCTNAADLETGALGRTGTVCRDQMSLFCGGFRYSRPLITEKSVHLRIDDCGQPQ